jgi:hypothetical protein
VISTELVSLIRTALVDLTGLHLYVRQDYISRSGQKCTSRSDQECNSNFDQDCISKSEQDYIIKSERAALLSLTGLH